VKGIANELNMNFLTVKGPELLNKYIGASEEAVRNLFRKAEEISPTLIFFDEFDSLAPCRGNDTTGVMDRVVNQLLTELDGISKHESVFIIAATSRPDAIDPAILRPGRIGRRVLCPMPSPTERAEIWECLLRDTKHETNISTAVLGAETAFYSGADIKAIIYNAQLSLVKKAIGTHDSKPAILNQELLLEIISLTKPSLSQSDLKDYELKYDNFLSGRTSVGWKTTQK
jgi:peroxin-1